MNLLRHYARQAFKQAKQMPLVGTFYWHCETLRGFVDSCTDVCDAGAGCGVGGRVCSLWRCSPAQTQHPTEDTATGAPAGGHGVRGRDIVQMGSHTFTTYLHLTLTRRYSSQVPASEPSIAQSNQWQVLASVRLSTCSSCYHKCY